MLTWVDVDIALAPTAEDKAQRLSALFSDYNAVGLTSVCDRDTSPDQIETYKQLRARGELTVRVCLSHHIDMAVGDRVERPGVERDPRHGGGLTRRFPPGKSIPPERG